MNTIRTYSQEYWQQPDTKKTVNKVKRLLRKHLIYTSEDYQETVEFLALKAKLSEELVQAILDRLAVENFVELRRTVQPWTVVKRF